MTQAQRARDLVRRTVPTVVNSDYTYPVAVINTLTEVMHSVKFGKNSYGFPDGSVLKLGIVSEYSRVTGAYHYTPAVSAYTCG